MKILVKNALVVSTKPPVSVTERGWISTDGGRISGHGMGKPPDGKWDLVVDAAGRLAMPALVNCHMHFYSTFARGMSLSGEPPRNFVSILEKLWWRIDRALAREDIEYSTLIPLIQAARSGVGTFFDHHASPSFIDGSLDAVAAAVEKAGLRAVLCYEVTDRGGFDRAAAGIEENVRFAEKVRRGRNGLLRAMMGLHASMTLSDETLARAAGEAARLSMPVHVHVAEDRADSSDSLSRSGCRIAHRLLRAGALPAGSIAAHCVHVNASEIEAMKEAGVFAVHNPQSNMNNAVGWANAPSMLAAGMRVGIGSDGMTPDVREEARAALLIARHATGDPAAGWQEAFRMLFDVNPEIASRAFGLKFGVMERGAAADVAVFDYVPPTPLTAENFFGHFIFGACSSRCTTLIVAGRPVLLRGKLAGVDEERVAARSRELAKALWARM